MVSIEWNYGKSMVSIDWRENQQEQWMKNGHLEYSPVIEELNTLSDGKKDVIFQRAVKLPEISGWKNDGRVVAWWLDNHGNS